MAEIKNYAPHDDGFGWVEDWLDLWVCDQCDPELGLEAPGKSAGFVAGGWGGYRDTADEWTAAANARAIGIINAALTDMSAAESCAVMHFKLAAVFRFNRPGVFVEDVYARARQKIGVRLRAADFDVVPQE